MKKPKQTFWLTQHTSHSSGGMRLSSLWWKSSLLISNTARTGRWCFCKSNVIVNTFQVRTLMRRALNRANPRATGNELLCSERGELHSLGVTYPEVDLVSDTGGKYISMRDSESMTTAQMLSWSFQVVLESSCWCSSFPPPLRMPLTGREGEVDACMCTWYRHLLKKDFNGVELIYNAVLVSGIQQSKSVIHIYVSTLFFLQVSYLSRNYKSHSLRDLRSQDGQWTKIPKE